MRKYLIFAIVFLLILTAFKSFEYTGFYIPENWPVPVYNFSKNPLTPEKSLLGKALFYDPILSSNNSISCSSCHLQYTAFAHVDHELSHGINDRIGTRNAPALMNLAWQKNFMYDGAINHLDMQPLAPISHPDEMGESFDNVLNKLRKSKIYPSLFAKSFGDTSITGERFLKAMSQFLLTLVSADSKYDQVKRNEAVFTDQEQKGYQIFKINCSSCHSEPLFTNYEFANNGLKPDPTLQDYGRMKITGKSKDSLLFKIPTLRNIEFSYPYMHDGRFKTLSEVLNHYTSGIKSNKTLSKELKNPIVLSSNEKVDLQAFLLTLTDRKFLFNPEFSYPKEIFLKTTKD